MIGECFWVLFLLVFYVLMFSMFIVFLVGIWVVFCCGFVVDVLVMGVMQFGVVILNFWFVMFMVLVFVINLCWFLVGGFLGWDVGFFVVMKVLILLVIVLVFLQVSIFIRVMWFSFLDIFSEDFICIVCVKGFFKGQVLWWYVVCNVLILVFMILGFQFFFLFVGVIIIENVFFLLGFG